MIYLYTKYEHYSKYVEKHKTDRLIKNVKITTNHKDILVKRLSLNEEIFNTPRPTNYNIESINNDILISFFTNSNTKYRLDLFLIEELDKEEQPINHIGFSNFNIKGRDEYDNETNKNEMIEVMNRIHFILKDLLNKKIINNSFCIGLTKSISKNNIYEYFLKIIVGEDGFDKISTKYYDSGFGLYFKI